MYINKGIYTYIPNPEPETPKPEPRIPTGVPGYWRTIVRFMPRQREAQLSTWSLPSIPNNCSFFSQAGGISR